MAKYSFYILPYFLIGKEPLAVSMARLARAGYDAVELPGEPGQFDVGEIRQLTERSHLSISSISGRCTPGRSLVRAPWRSCMAFPSTWQPVRWSE